MALSNTVQSKWSTSSAKHVVETTSQDQKKASLQPPEENVIGLDGAAGSTDEPGEELASIWAPMNRSRLFAVCLASFANGFSDAGAGAIIPFMERHYDIGYAVVSVIFVGQAIGFALTAVFFDGLRAKLGRANLFCLSNVVMMCGYIPIFSGAPYPLIPISFCLVGFGAAINISLGNLFCGSLQKSTFMLGLLHGCYGIGATASPLLATAMVATAGALWSRFYLINLGLAAIILVLSAWSFWTYDKELSRTTRAKECPSEESTLHGVLCTLRARVVILGAIFILAYQGAEVSISGWIISFLIDSRHGASQSVGYVSSGFWGGITISRFVLSGLAQRWGEKPLVFALTAGAFAFQLIIWFVPNIIGNAVATAVVGIMLGPIYPCAAALLMRKMTHREALKGMVTVTAFGSLGGALAPFVTGLFAQAVGTFVLHPICIFQYVVMVACWYGVPAVVNKS